MSTRCQFSPDAATAAAGPGRTRDRADPACPGPVEASGDLVRYPLPVFHARSVETEDGRALLRVRLAAIALGTTLLVLAPAGDRGAGALVIVLFAALACLLRLGAGRMRGDLFAGLGIVADVVYASALVSTLPLDSPSWALYAFAIGGAALRHGSWGAVAGTAGSIVAYDAALAMRAGQATAVELWPLQVLIAVGLLAAELVHTAARGARERHDLRSLAVAERDLATATGLAELRDRLTTHVVASFGADRAAVVHETVATEWANVRRPLDVDGLVLAARIDPPDEARIALAADLVSCATPLLRVLLERDAHREAAEVADRLATALERVDAQSDAVSLLAQLGMGAGGLGGPTSVVRLNDGAVVAGDPLGADAVAMLRDSRAPSVIGARDAARFGESARGVVVVPAGPGAVLVRVFSEREPTDAELRALRLVGATAGALLTRIAERDEVTGRLAELRDLTDGLRDQLREREDAMRTTVHELRTPITSVAAYGQLIARNLQSALQQVAQLDRLIGDLRGGGAAVSQLVLSDADLLKEAKDAAQRQRILHDAVVAVDAAGAKAFPIRADRGRLAQVLDNLLDNAVKYSPRGAAIRVVVRREGDEVLLEVRDEGAGIAPADLERVFERYYRSDGATRTTTGTGIGLALSRDIVQAHEGRIWAESAGEGRGSTFTIALALAVAAKAE